MTAEDIFITRETAWDTLEVQLGLGCEYYDEQYSPPRGSAQSVNLTVSTANFGYADLADTVPIEEVEGATFEAPWSKRLSWSLVTYEKSGTA
jgi:hypothetical protein